MRSINKIPDFLREVDKTMDVVIDLADLVWCFLTGTNSTVLLELDGD